MYFPRVLVPLSATLAAFVDFAIAFLVLGGLMAWYGLAPAATAVFVIPLVVVTACTAAGVGMWLGALNARYRDVQYALPFLMQLWMFATPVVYPASLVPEGWRPLLALNPLAGLVEGFRACDAGPAARLDRLGSRHVGAARSPCSDLAVRRMERASRIRCCSPYGLAGHRVRGLSKRYWIGAPSRAAVQCAEALTDLVTAPFRRLARLGAPPQSEDSGRSAQSRRRGAPARCWAWSAGTAPQEHHCSDHLAVTEPTAGRVELFGRVGSLLEVGNRFHPDLTVARTSI